MEPLVVLWYFDEIETIQADLLQPAVVNKILGLEYAWEKDKEVIAQLVLLYTIIAYDRISLDLRAS